MNIIHTILRNGQCLMPEVLRGALENDCAILPITSWTEIGRVRGKPDRKNILSNWQEAFRFVDENEPFIGMDSDVVLPLNIIAEMKAALYVPGVHVVTVGDIEQTPRQHAVLMTLPEVAKSFPPFTPNDCPLCAWIDEIKRRWTVVDMPTYFSVSKIARFELKRIGGPDV